MTMTSRSWGRSTTFAAVAATLAWSFVLFQLPTACHGRPVVRNIRSTHEFDRLLEKHATETGLPVVVDFYSDSCGPCRMMAPIFKKVAADYMDKAVFVKIDTNAQPELSGRYQIRSLPTFQFFLGGVKVHQALGGIGEASLRQETESLVRQADAENVILSLQALTEFYQSVGEKNKSAADIQAVHVKCVDMTKSEKKKRQQRGEGECVGAAANQLARKLRKKYNQKPKLVPRFTKEDRQSKKSKGKDDDAETPKQRERKTSGGSGGGNNNKPNLHLATKEELQAELERRLDDERENEVEQEDADEDEADPELSRRWKPSSFPERVVIIGGGPAGLSAALYAARAGLKPLVLAPSMGGQLQGKGVDVENYPGLFNQTGPAVIAAMRKQAAHFGALFEDDTVVSIRLPASTATADEPEVKPQPLQVVTNGTGAIQTHSIIVATGAESNWLGVPGEYELRGGGVSSCAVCDGFLYSGKNVIVVGGGDAAMEDALVLARTSRKVTVVHRRNVFRASKVLAQRVLDHPLITVRWNTVVEEIVGKIVESTTQAGSGDDDEDAVQDLDNLQKVVSAVSLKDVVTGEKSKLNCDAVFVAIGHTPATSFLKGVVEFNPDTAAGYIQTFGRSTHTSQRGIFAAGDVADAVYRQAITSAGSGAAAALDAERYLSEHGLGNEEAELEAELMREWASETTSAAEDSGSSNSAYNIYEEAGGRMHGMKESMAAEL